MQMKSGYDFNTMIDVETKIIKIQALMRSRLARNYLARDAEARLRKLEYNKRRNVQSREETAMREFAQRLKNKTKLTPEGFFRYVDVNYEKQVPATTFRLELEKVNLKLSKA